MNKVSKNPKTEMDKPLILSYLAWGLALISMLGSLYFSDIMGLVPCLLCWYQRILMYPLVWIIPYLAVKKDQNLPMVVLPLSGFGTLMALFHYLLQMKVFPESIAPCVEGVSCVKEAFKLFGFITIPLLSFVAFLIITILMLMLKNHYSKSSN